MASTSSAAISTPPSPPIPPEPAEPAQARFHLRRELYTLPLLSFLLGGSMGIMRGARLTSLRFAAENAHRAPTTMQGWYFYNKTKNYRVMMGALKGAARQGAQLGAVGVVWVGCREVGEWAGMGEWAEAAAGVGVATGVAAFYRLPSRQATRVVSMGAVAGVVMSLLRKLQVWVGEKAAEEERRKVVEGASA